MAGKVNEIALHIEAQTLLEYIGISELECNMRGCCYSKKSCVYPDARAVTYYRQRNVFPELHAESLGTQSCVANVCKLYIFNSQLILFINIILAFCGSRPVSKTSLFIC